MPTNLTPDDIAKGRALCEAATDVRATDLMAYEHGGGRLAVIRDGERELVADFYGDGPDRDAIMWLIERRFDLLSAAERVVELTDMAQFLIDRIDDMDWCGDIEEFANNWNGHVDPPLCRLRAALAKDRQ